MVKYSDFSEAKKERIRARARADSKRKHAAAALAAGREPGTAGRPRVLTDEQRGANRKAVCRAYRHKDIDATRAIESERMRKRTRDRAEAAGRKLAKPGERYSVTPRTKEERLALRRTVYCERYREKNRAAMRAAYAADPEKFMERNRVLKETDPERFRAYKATHGRNRRARILGTPEKHSTADIRWLWERQRGCCVLCLEPLPAKGFHIDHHEPLARGGSNDRNNLRLLHKRCNQSKSARDPIEYAREHGLLCW